MSRLISDYLTPPSESDYNSTMISRMEHNRYSEEGQDVFLDKIVFKENVKNGFFMEAGADDFVDGSTTLMFELNHNWTGLLVEPSPLRYVAG